MTYILSVTFRLCVCIRTFVKRLFRLSGFGWRSRSNLHASSSGIMRDREDECSLKLEDINEAFDVLDRGEAVRQVVVFD